jgi:hypothetical protein
LDQIGWLSGDARHGSESGHSETSRCSVS